jgi:hypothetical protein
MEKLCSSRFEFPRLCLKGFAKHDVNHDRSTNGFDYDLQNCTHRMLSTFNEAHFRALVAAPSQGIATLSSAPRPGKEAVNAKGRSRR